MNPLVSFVVPCYRLAHLLPQCVNSILSQDYENFEILIMDNCSPDNTPDVAASFKDPRVKHIRNESNLGHVRNFNKGIALASGKYVWLISPDDWLRGANALTRYVEMMERNPGIGFVFCQAIDVEESREVGVAEWTNLGPKDCIWEGRSFFMRLIQGDCVVLSAAMVRKECYEKFGMFSLEMPHSNDWYLWFILSLHYQVGYVAEPMVYVRTHQASLTSSFNQGGNPLCVIDELTVLWRAARLAEDAGLVSDRRVFNEAIATMAGEALTYGPHWSATRMRPGLKDADLHALVRRYAKDTKDERDIRARIYIVVGDEEFWHSQYQKAAQAYWLALKLRPWWVRTWVKYVLLWTGGPGLYIRRFVGGLRESRGEARRGQRASEEPAVNAR